MCTLIIGIFICCGDLWNRSGAESGVRAFNLYYRGVCPARKIFPEAWRCGEEYGNRFCDQWGHDDHGGSWYSHSQRKARDGAAERADVIYGTEWRGKSIHDTADLRADHSGRGFHSCKYGGSHGKKDLQRPGKNAEG